MARNGEVAPIKAYEDICEYLIERGIVENDVLLDFKEILCHPGNRSKTGLNGYNAHQNGDRIVKAGFTQSELNKAAVFEMSIFEPQRSEQINANKRFVHMAGGMLAPPWGKEKYMSVGTGHFIAFVRAALAGCVSPIKDLTDGSGRLNAELIRKKDPRMGSCMDTGIKVRKFPWQAEAAWPQLPDLCQRALNATNEINAKNTELEVMCAIADLDEQRREGQTFESIIESLALSTPPCLQYIMKVGKLATLIGGGPGAPYVKFMDRFGKRFGEDKVLGEEFVCSLVDLVFSKTEKVVAVRIGMILCDIVTDKIVDGISKCIVKTDVERMKGTRY